MSTYDVEADNTGPSEVRSEYNAADDNGAYQKGQWVWQPTGGAPRRVYVPSKPIDNA